MEGMIKKPMVLHFQSFQDVFVKHKHDPFRVSRLEFNHFMESEMGRHNLCLDSYGLDANIQG